MWVPLLRTNRCASYIGGIGKMIGYWDTLNLSHIMCERERENIFQERPKLLKFSKTRIESVSEGQTEGLCH